MGQKTKINISATKTTRLKKKPLPAGTVKIEEPKKTVGFFGL